jgi:hypothetical protein
MREMKENGAAPAPYARRKIEVEYADEVIKPVVAPKVLGSRVGGQDDSTIIFVRSGIVAPTVGSCDCAGIRSRNGPGLFSSSPSDKFELTDRRSSVSFFSFRSNSVPANGARKRERTHHH